MVVIVDSSIHFEDCGTHFRGRVVATAHHRAQAVVSVTHCDGVRLTRPEEYAYMIVPIRDLLEWYDQ